MTGAAGRTRLAVIFGGRSVEHEVSAVSAQGVMGAADRDRFEVIPFGITRGGAWLAPDETQARLARIAAGETRSLGDDPGAGALAYPEVMALLASVDVAFPIVHGPFGEDGTLQGLLEMADIPYVGAGVTASSVGMDKELMRAAFRSADIPQACYRVLRDGDARAPSDEAVRDIERDIGYPCFVKPTNGGSSVGVGKARSREDLLAAIAEATRYDRKVMVEQAIEGREIECAVLGNTDPRPSPVGEIRPLAEFYTYDAKYMDGTTELLVPAPVSDAVREAIQELAVRAFRAIDCAGLARVDYFLTPEDTLRVIEINTLPGFTPISMYPRLWQEAGISYGDLIGRLVDLALERHAETRSRV